MSRFAYQVVQAVGWLVMTVIGAVWRGVGRVVEGALRLLGYEPR